MAIPRTPRVMLVLLLLALLPLLLTTPAAPPAMAQASSSTLLVYHQLTDRFGGSEDVGHPVISADGRWAVFAESALSSPPEVPVRVFVVSTNGGPPTQVDSYTPTGGGTTKLDISADGETIVSSDGWQLRIASAASGGQGRELLRLARAEISVLRLSGDGHTVFFLAQADMALPNGAPLLRGLWAVPADGGPPRHLVGSAQVAGTLGLPVAALGGPETYFYLSGGADTLAVSGDGGRVAFAAFGAAFGDSGEFVFTVSGQGEGLQVLAGPFESVGPVAISGDGRTVAFARPARDQDDYVYNLVVLAGGVMRDIGLGSYYLPGGGERLQLSADGGQLLVGSSQGDLIDVASGKPRALAVAAPGARLLTAGVIWATMSGDAKRILYVVRDQTRQQLALLEIGPVSVGAAPEIAKAELQPLEIPWGGPTGATATARVDGSGTLVGVWLVALGFDRQPDRSIGGGPLVLRADPQGDPDIYLTDRVLHLPKDETDPAGSRELRIQAEIEAPNGWRHAAAVDGLRVTVVDQAEDPACAVDSGVVYSTEQALPGMEADWRAGDPPAVAVQAFHAELSLAGVEAITNLAWYELQVTGGCFRIKVVNQDTGSSYTFRSSRVVAFGFGGEGVVQFQGTSVTVPASIYDGTDVWVAFSLALSDDARTVVFCRMSPTDVPPTREECLANPIAVLPRVS